MEHWKSARACNSCDRRVVCESMLDPGYAWCMSCLAKELATGGLRFAVRRMYVVVDGKLMHDTLTVAEILERHGG